MTIKRAKELHKLRIKKLREQENLVHEWSKLALIVSGGAGFLALIFRVKGAF